MPHHRPERIDDTPARIDGPRCAVVGDVHLRVNELASLLRGPLRLADRVILLGDLLDRGPGRVREALDLASDPRVTLLCGNHELAYLGGPVYRGMREPAGRAAAEQLRALVLDGQLRAATSVGGILCVHAGVSHAFWKQELARHAGADTQAIAAELNRRFVLGVGRRDFSDPIFAALDADVRGPFWASLDADLVAAGLPPFDQAVGHTKVRAVEWHSCGAGSGSRVLATCTSERDPAGLGWAWI